MSAEETTALNRQDAKDAKNNDRWWWVKMLAASAAIAALLFGVYFLAPVAQLHYHAWRFRSDRYANGKHLKPAADILVARRANKEAIIRLLGKPAETTGDGDSCKLVYMVGLHFGYRITVENGKAASISEAVFMPPSPPAPAAAKGYRDAQAH